MIDGLGEVEQNSDLTYIWSLPSCTLVLTPSETALSIKISQLEYTGKHQPLVSRLHRKREIWTIKNEL